MFNKAWLHVQNCRFASLRPCPHLCVVIEIASIDSRQCPHYPFDAFSTDHTKTFENGRIVRCGVSWTLCACYKHTRLRYFGHRFHFVAFSTVFAFNTKMICCFDPLSRAFSDRCVFDENAQRINVDGRPTRIEMYAFSNENALVWTRV